MIRGNSLILGDDEIATRGGAPGDVVIEQLIGHGIEVRDVPRALRSIDLDRDIKIMAVIFGRRQVRVVHPGITEQLAGGDVLTNCNRVG